MSERIVIRIADFFSGLHSWTKPYEALDPTVYDVRVFSIDNNPKYAHNTTVIDDFLNIDAHRIVQYLDGVPDIIYASIPCTTFSVASIGHHWMGGHRAYVPKTEECKKGLALLNATVSLIQIFKGCNKNLHFFIENPRGVMRKMDILSSFNRSTIWHCKYGKTGGILRAKPTDIWHSGKYWIPRPVCKNHTFKEGLKTSTHCNHVSARRGAKTGTQGMNGNAERSLIPQELCADIMDQVFGWGRF